MTSQFIQKKCLQNCTLNLNKTNKILNLAHMQRYISVLLLIFITNLSFAQNHQTPDWLQDLPYNTSEYIYAIGFSDPKMSDSILAKNLALNRALAIAVMVNQSQVSYASDFYEAKSEEHRWYITKESFEEFGKIKASAYVNNNYEIVKSETNSNGELIILLKFFPSQEKGVEHNFNIEIEYYSQVFELSNTRALEHFRNIMLNTCWTNLKTKDSLKTYYELSNYNNYINIKESYGTLEIEAPRFHYNYKPSLANKIDFKDFSSYSPLQKGLWQSYLDSYTQSIFNINKNHSSKIGTIQDEFKRSKNTYDSQQGQGQKTESLTRNTLRNTLNFELGGIEIYNNYLYNRVYLQNKRPSYSNVNSSQIKNENSNNAKDKKSKEWFFKRWFKKKS